MYGEVVAMKLVLQRTIAQLAAQTGNMESILKIEHARAIEEFRHQEIVDDDPDRLEQIRAHGESVIDQIYTGIRMVPRPTS